MVGGMNEDERSMIDSSANVPPLLRERDLPGPMSMHWLERMGIIQFLDDTNAYGNEYSTSVFGRAQVALQLVPRRSIACAQTAAWVWLGGQMPSTVDVLSSSHFRSTVFGRRIRVFNRKPYQRQIQRIGGLQLTSPAATAVDLATIRRNETDSAVSSIGARISDLMDGYKISPEYCLGLLDENPYLSSGPQAREFFEDMLPNMPSTGMLVKGPVKRPQQRSSNTAA